VEVKGIDSFLSEALTYADDLGSTVDPVPIVVFDTMAAVSSISLALTLAPAVLSPNVHRSKAWFSMITTMMIFPLLYLLNVGSQFNYHDSPPIGLCILQTGFIYAGMFFMVLLKIWLLNFVAPQAHQRTRSF
jgi:hypothetical protein